MGSAVRGTLQASLDRLHPNTRANPDHRSEPIHAEMAESDRRWSGHRGTSQSPGPVLLRRQCTKPDEEPEKLTTVITEKLTTRSYLLRMMLEYSVPSPRPSVLQPPLASCSALVGRTDQ